MKSNDELRDYLLFHRQRLHLSKASLAKAIEVPLKTLSDWEQGISRPDATQRAALKQLFGESFDHYLLEHHPRIKASSRRLETIFWSTSLPIMLASIATFVIFGFRLFHLETLVSNDSGPLYRIGLNFNLYEVITNPHLFNQTSNICIALLFSFSCLIFILTFISFRKPQWYSLLATLSITLFSAVLLILLRIILTDLGTWLWLPIGLIFALTIVQVIFYAIHERDVASILKRSR